MGAKSVQQPLQITYRDVMQSDAIDELIREETDRLERFYPRIVSCHVTIERAHRHIPMGAPFHVRIEIALPGGQVTIKADPQARRESDAYGVHKDAALTVREAFRRAKRRIQDFSRLRRGDVKHHEPQARGSVSSLETR